MTLHKIKQVFVDDKKLMSEKQLGFLVVRISLSFITLLMDIGLLTYRLLNTPITVLVVIGGMLAFVWVFDLLDEDESSIKQVSVFSWMFILFLILFFVEYFVLKHYNFF